mmetsp:Transcript_8405/g.30990  ORF Transcript_8405/g.30990 Transcript_8405/m.30990 type:complete len:84 (+) Transcript_8405:1735-1986(+)
MDDDGLIALMDALSCNQFLSSLDFSRNRITSVGLQQLVKCLRKGPRNVLSVNLEQNLEIDGSPLLGELRDILRRNLKAREKLT